MSTKTLISLDPGMSTGLVVGTYSDTEPFKLTHAFQIGGGVAGFLRNVRTYENGYRDRILRVLSGRDYLSFGEGGSTVLVEKFNARGSANAGFSYTTASLEPLRVEGAILALGIEPIWVQPSQQYFNGGKNKAEKKKRQHAWLKTNGFAIMPKDVGAADADDARSACAHAISWLRRQRHEPTLKHYFKEDE